MALSDEVSTRYSSTYLTGISNPDDPDASSVDATRLAAAADDVEAQFLIVAGVAFDATDATHVTVAVEGVVALLRQRTGKDPDSETQWTRFLDNLQRLARVEGRNRVIPASNSLLQPSEDDRLTDTPRPAFDDRRFDPFIPAHPSGGVSVSFTEE